MSRSVAQKMGLKAGTRTLFVHAPEAALAAIELPSLDVSATIDGEFGYIHLFVVMQAEMEELFPKLKAHLHPTGALWVSWPKGRQGGSDLALPHVIRIGYSHGLVESTTLRVDDTWSAIKFTHPKPGKVYRNSYGQLPDR
ncbi:MAG TPA: hypothetical protein VFS21_13760 [Roseiflexaceae bacterium]|nr:hypothetical protein [Roseiflexaceae bacterium]